MKNADNPGGLPGQPFLSSDSVELLIVGGGVMGLWAAVHANRAGIRTLLVDAASAGSGASGGLLGALMAHMPDRWSEKKQFQFDCLVSLEQEIAWLEGETGMSCGYSRSGRIIPLPKPHLRAIAERHEQDALVNWRHGERQFHWHVRDELPAGMAGSGWLDAACGQAGFVHDTLGARVSPRRFCSALRAYLAHSRHVTVREGSAVQRLDPCEGVAVLEDGGQIRFGRAILAAGHQAFALLQQAIGWHGAHETGQPVKGQAALLRASVDSSLPLVFMDGLYIVPHEDGYVAVGSTSENDFNDPYATDEKLDSLIARARELSPALAGAEVAERWAGLRPKAAGIDPMVGVHPDFPRLTFLGGGFKVSFGIAHRLAQVALGAPGSENVALPPSFDIMAHLAAAETGGNRKKRPDVTTAV